MGLLNRDYADITGEILFEGTDLLKLSPEELRKIRGRDVSMIFQDPFACLHPMYRVGAQIAEAVQRARRRLEEGGVATARSSCSARSASRTRSCGRATTRTSSRAACASAR